jgi:hypothetical protein
MVVLVVKKPKKAHYFTAPLSVISGGNGIANALNAPAIRLASTPYLAQIASERRPNGSRMPLAAWRAWEVLDMSAAKSRLARDVKP